MPIGTESDAGVGVKPITTPRAAQRLALGLAALLLLVGGCSRLQETHEIVLPEVPKSQAPALMSMRQDRERYY